MAAFASALLASLLAPATTAATLTYQYTSTVNAVPIGLGAAETVQITYSVDDAASDIESVSPTWGRYFLQAMTVRVGAFTATLTNPSSAVIDVIDNSPVDRYGVGTDASYVPVFAGSINGFQLGLTAMFSVRSTNQGAWTSDALVTSASLLNALPETQLVLAFNNTIYLTHPGSTIGQFSTTPFTLTAVPLPAAGWLFVSALAGVATIRRRR